MDSQEGASAANSVQLVGSSGDVAFPNWNGLEEVPVSELLGIAKDDGIPIAWVPPADVLRQLLDTSGHEARLSVLVRNEEVILSDCDAEIRSWTNPDTAELLAIALKALNAFQAGHREAAACLALLAAEDTFYGITGVPRNREGFDPAYIRRLRRDITKENSELDAQMVDRKLGKHLAQRSSYAGMTKRAPYKRPDPGWGDLLNPGAVFVPLESLYVSYWGRDGEQAPPNLSRHLVAHRPSLAHLNPGHCLTALMLMVSFFAQHHLYCEQADQEDAWHEQ